MLGFFVGIDDVSVNINAEDTCSTNLQYSSIHSLGAEIIFL
jgi:hypothetical protein